jgi:hypothetical protein
MQLKRINHKQNYYFFAVHLQTITSAIVGPQLLKIMKMLQKWYMLFNKILVDNFNFLEIRFSIMDAYAEPTDRKLWNGLFDLNASKIELTIEENCSG